ncbi:hypothetical protein PIB30_113628, partial [Stylosanthes scabra]|nr:hypothetical protein [Stylosanthes scabra]
MKINSADPASTKPPNKQIKESVEDSHPPPSQQKEETTIPPPKEKKKKEPVTYMPKPPHPQRLKAENKAPKKEPKEENATNDSMKFQLIQK